jgi:hypothetical protein
MTLEVPARIGRERISKRPAEFAAVGISRFYLGEDPEKDEGNDDRILRQ